MYLHWDFHRDEIFACSTNGAQPYILNNPAGPKNEGPAPPVPGPANTPHERGTPSTGPNDAREGFARAAFRPRKSLRSGWVSTPGARAIVALMR